MPGPPTKPPVGTGTVLREPDEPARAPPRPEPSPPDLRKSPDRLAKKKPKKRRRRSKKKDKKKISNVLEVDFDDQMFLLDFLKLFPNIVPSKPPRRTQTHAKPYANFAQIKTDAPAGIIGRLIGEDVDALHDFTTAQLSSLVPYVRLFKSYRVGKKWIDDEYPFGQPTDAAQMLQSNLHRGYDAGIQSLNWTDLGKNPITSGWSFKGTLTLFFQSFDALFRSLGTPSGHLELKFADLLDLPRALTGQSSVASDGGGMSDLSLSRSTKTKVEIGWMGSENAVLDRSEVRALNKVRRVYVLHNASQELKINTQDGSVTIEITFVAGVEGRAATPKADLLFIDENNVKSEYTQNLIKVKQHVKQQEALRNEADSSLKRSTERLEIIDGEIAALKAKPDWGKRQANPTGDFTPPGLSGGPITNSTLTEAAMNLDWKHQALIEKKARATEAVAKNKANKDAINKEIVRMGAEKRSISYKRVINSIRNYTETGGKLPYIDLSSAGINMYKHIVVERAEVLAGRVKKSSTGGRSSGSEGKLMGEKYHAILTQLIKKAPSRGQIGKAKAGPVRSKKKAKKQGTQHQKPNFLNPEGYHRLHYFYLGDLLEGVLQIIYRRPSSKSGYLSNQDNVKSKEIYREIRLALGTIEVVNPATGKQETVELCDLPISWKYFKGWWYKNVVKLQIDHLYLTDFLSSLCQELLNNILNPLTYGKSSISYVPRIVASPIFVPETSYLNKVFRSSRRTSTKSRLTLDSITRQDRNALGYNRNVVEWLYLGVHNAPLKNIYKYKDSERLDRNRAINIPTFYIGAQTGLVKDISFQKTQIPQAIQAAIVRGGSKVAGNLLFQDVYSANLKLFGNPILRTGMLIFIDPKGLQIDINNPVTVDGSMPLGAIGLGIGGYYTVKNVSLSFAEGEFTTELAVEPTKTLRDIWHWRQTAEGRRKMGSS